jgi:hypothetical protein
MKFARWSLLLLAVGVFALACRGETGTLPSEPTEALEIAGQGPDKQIQQGLVHFCHGRTLGQAERLFRSALQDWKKGRTENAQAKALELAALVADRCEGGIDDDSDDSNDNDDHHPLTKAELLAAILDRVGLLPPGASIPEGALTEEGAVTLCGPNGCQWVTGTEFGGGVVPPGFFDGPVLIVMERLADEIDPFASSGFEGFPLFFDIQVFGDEGGGGSESLALAQDGEHAVVGVCVVDPPDPLAPPEGTEVQLAHRLESGEVELLEPVPAPFLDCTGASTTDGVASRAWLRWANAVVRPIASLVDVPRAGAAGLGGAVINFSAFGGVAVDGDEEPPPPPPGTDIVVFNDVNVFDNTAMADANNVLLVQNLVDFTAGKPRDDGDAVWIDCRAPAHGVTVGGCSPSTFQTTIAGEGFTVVMVTEGGLDEIPADVKTIFLWIPTLEYTAPEITAFKQFAEEGGRVVFVGEHAGFYGEWIPQQNAFLQAMGAVMENTGGFVDCADESGYPTLPASSLRPHQITTGMTGVTVACSSVIEAGPSDFVLYFDSSGTEVLSGVATIDTEVVAIAEFRSRVIDLEGVPRTTDPARAGAGDSP